MHTSNKNNAKVVMRIFVICFFSFLWLPTLDLFFGLDHAPTPNENRASATWPSFAFTLAQVHALPGSLEAYYNDHFGFRKRLIRWEHKWKRKWFDDFSCADVLIGRNGWLYYSGEGMIDHYRGTKLFTTTELFAWQGILEKRRDWLARRGIKYLFVVPPDKQTVDPEYLPDWMTKVAPKTKLDQFVEHMRSYSTVPVLDLREPLRVAKQFMQPYQQTDTHWNFYGGFIGYQAVVRALAHQLPGLDEPLSLESFKFTFHLRAGGDLARMLDRESAFPEKTWIRSEPVPPLRMPVIDIDSAPSPSVPALMHMDNPAQRYRLLMFRDSYSGQWMPYFYHNFRRAAFLWQYVWDCRLIEREHPDVVVDEMLERYLCNTETRKLQMPDGEH